MATNEELLDQYSGQFIPYSFQAGYVCLSYAVSLIGAGATLELVRRQTSNKGLHNLLLLTGTAISMGGIAIWSMHYIGNRAIYMLDGEKQLQIAYTTGLTVLSLFVPIIALFVAFVIISSHGRVCWVRIVVSGTVSGCTLVGMHYLADASIRNYRAVYRPAYIVGAALMAVVANITVLACFFVFEAAWTNAWWRRMGSAMVLAGAVSGVHWCAAAGTRYRLLHLYNPGDGLSRDDSLITVICLSVAASVLMTTSAVYSRWIRSDYAKKAQKVVLAAAVFDQRGRIMVSKEGLLPSEVVTDTYIPTSNIDVFDTSNPVFHWMFWASQNWPNITRAIDGMEKHVASLSSTTFSRKIKVKLLGDDGEAVENYNTILCELFCLASTALASKMKDTLEASGTLWDDILATGDDSSGAAEGLVPPSPTSTTGVKSQTDFLGEKGLTASLDEQGRGSLMFLVRHVQDRRDIERLESAGYRFAELHHVLDTIHGGMQIKTRDFAARLRNMSHKTETTTTMGPGVHVGLFAIRARLDYGGFDVLVQKNARQLLPTMPLPLEGLEPWQTELLGTIQGLTASTVIRRLEDGAFGLGRGRGFAIQLRNSITSLRLWIDNAILDDAKLVSRVVRVPCSAAGSELSCSLIAFQLVLPIHFNLSFRNLESVPLQFFKMHNKLLSKGL
ncbi:mhyt [Ophiocordyceps sinensis CO18]|uniref:Mhyt n=1 Tax=Ophiocordyceps sinensis (strain Co18 / CGMCC 3.14243) TaxID=911162 RepID=T5ABX8_OPHSC|nr:mhyt [Ophiocordyceps sinensis CO18]